MLQLRSILYLYFGISVLDCFHSYSYWPIRSPLVQWRTYSSIIRYRAINFCSLSNPIQNRQYTQLFMNNYELENDSLSIKDEIAAVIGIFLSTDEASLRERGLNCMAYADLMERSYILCKGRIYESIMDDLLQSSASMDDTRKIEQVDVIIRGFVLSERKVRSRQKMNYILAGASTNRLDSAIRTLSESDELDEDLVTYSESLIRKEIARSLGSMGKSLSMASLSENEAEFEREQEKLLQGIGQKTVEVLKMILRRLKAQIATTGMDDLQLLAVLLQEEDPSSRMLVLRKELKRVEAIESFWAFVQDGVEHIRQNGGSARDPNDVKTTVELSANTISKMEDILYDMSCIKKELETGLMDMTYSTVADDYSENRGAMDSGTIDRTPDENTQ